MRKILALDLATETGWARNSDVPGRPVWGHFKLGKDGDNFGPAYSDLFDRVDALVLGDRPDTIVFEKSIVPKGGGNGQTSIRTSDDIIRYLAALGGIVEVVAHKRGIETWQIAIPTWKKHFAGSGHAKKEQVRERCRLLGWDVTNLNASDACGQWSYAQAILDPGFAYQSTPLFGARRA